MGTNQKKKRRFVKQGILLVLGLIALAWGSGYGLRLFSERELVEITFQNPDGTQPANFKLEVANDELERKKGLMFRKTLHADRGMIFVHQDEADHAMWMKETYIPLDMIFLNSRFEVVGVLKNVPILNLERRQINKPSKFVVELAAGSADTKGIEVGDKAIISDPAKLNY